MLRAWLDWHRATLLRKCAGLGAAQLATRAVPPSNLSLLGLIRHMSDTERGWVRQTYRGEQVPAFEAGRAQSAPGLLSWFMIAGYGWRVRAAAANYHVLAVTDVSDSGLGPAAARFSAAGCDLRGWPFLSAE
jgi:Protein of unknown function (DUF664)